MWRYPLDSDWSSEQRYPSFEQLGPKLHNNGLNRKYFFRRHWKYQKKNIRHYFWYYLELQLYKSFHTEINELWTDQRKTFK